ncbi:MAG: hypothetical protein GC168_16985 [Candidatus Hydrogenedens sp.]|nr:hypothetical protein [Candidatus Hydrogenedens sp.]
MCAFPANNDGVCNLAPWRLALGVALLAFVAASTAHAVLQPVFSQPPSDAGGLALSSRVLPDGSDSDTYAYEAFSPGTDTAVVEVRWRGGYQYAAQYGRVQDFMITFYGVLQGTSQPSLGFPPAEEQTTALAQYDLGSIAGESPAGIFGGVAMYDYHYTLPAPFAITAGTLYWVRIEAVQPTYPDWGLAAGTGGNGSHFQYNTGTTMFRYFPKDPALTLYADIAASVQIAASANPPEGGVIQGTGEYAEGALATLVAMPNPGFEFLNWTENGTEVSTVASYSFTADSNRDLVANFMAIIPVEGEGAGPATQSADQNGDFSISLAELLRVIQFFNASGLHCAEVSTDTEDGFVPGPGANQSCAPHSSDYDPQDWVIGLSEQLRLIQFFNLGGYHDCPDAGTEDGFCAGPA